MSNLGFQITLDLSSQVSNFLDVTFTPYRKPNCLIKFINTNSDHTHHIKKVY